MSDVNRLFGCRSGLFLFLANKADDFSAGHFTQAEQHDASTLKKEIAVLLRCIAKGLNEGFDLRIQNFCFFSIERNNNGLTALKTAG